ncbi:ribonuclease III [Candidatus Peregrinibacteria bacterium CG10_big_fil_rev_8_21_14_0_10_49_16]|nr:MAG: ribonuclease III [Candidatus Peregrinibacteria bacterium CG22_combo_CG10-13_8_21_14_all_49_11]PIR52403.1 MAG: ribonuclease III [Candidatus Peregrinibacteria bacterium CG10_big_fil_rev_8_21_14_0_10_49_16]
MVSPPKSFTELENAIGVRFRDKEILSQALTHRSAVQQSRAHGHNERLEFLGDAVLELVTTDYLFHLTDRPEGELTNWRSALVQRENLAKVAREISLGEHLFMSRGEQSGGGRNRDSNLANALEALIGAMYVDRGFEVSKEFCERFILTHLKELLAEGKHRDEKSFFQECAQEELGITPKYEVVDAVGPDHSKDFTCAVYLGDEKVAEGKGNSKQKAEQAAAKEALKVKGWK